MKIIERSLDIVDFIRDPQILNDQTLSPAQITFLKSFFALPLDDAEMEIFRRATGRVKYTCQKCNESTLFGGRRGGKTSKIGASIVIYECCCHHNIPRGERAYGMLIAPTIAQAKINFDYILNAMRNSPLLKRKIKKVSANEIELTNGVVIGCYACSFVTLRGRAAIVVVLDEFCFFRNEITSVHCDKEILAAVRPMMATFPDAKLVKISTPYAKRGVGWEEFQRRNELGHLVWQLTSQELNPTISSEYLESEQIHNPQEYAREYLAQFTDSVCSWIEPEALARCVISGRRELPRMTDVVYGAAMDPGFKNSEFALAISHRTSTGLIVVDCLRFWAGTKQAPLGFEWVCREIADILQSYGINTAHGDQYVAPAIDQEFRKLGIIYREVTSGRQTRPRLFTNLAYLIDQRRIEILDDQKLLSQFRSLELRREKDGNLDVRAPEGVKDDMAIALALCVFELSQASNEPLLPPISLGRVSRIWDDRIADMRGSLNRFPVGPEVCSKFPKCWDSGHCECYGF